MFRSSDDHHQGAFWSWLKSLVKIWVFKCGYAPAYVHSFCTLYCVERHVNMSTCLSTQYNQDQKVNWNARLNNMILLTYSIPTFQEISLLKFSMPWRSTNQDANQGTSTRAASLGPLAIPVYCSYRGLVVRKPNIRDFITLIVFPSCLAALTCTH
jgi:hypothetical protein